MKQLNFFYTFSIVLLISILSSCSHNKLKDVDISHVKINPVKLLRMDEGIFFTKPDAFKQEAKKMKTKYGNFYNSFIFEVLNHGEEHDSVYKAMALFVQDADMKQVFNQSRKVFTNEVISGIENQLSDGLKHLKYHLPQTVLPKQYVSFISGFNYNITTMDSTLGIGLDMYLGSDNKYYQMFYAQLHH